MFGGASSRGGRAVEPHAYDRRCGSFGSDAPGERLAERSCAHAVTAKPAIPVSVRERAASRHRPRVCASRALKSDADPQWRSAVRRPRLVDLLQEALLQSAEESRLRQLRRGSARRQHERRNARDRQDDEGAAPSSHDGAVLPRSARSLGQQDGAEHDQRTDQLERSQRLAQPGIRENGGGDRLEHRRDRRPRGRDVAE